MHAVGLWVAFLFVGAIAWVLSRLWWRGGRRWARVSPGSFPFERVAVVGVTSSGKSTAALALVARLRLELVELDALNWDAGWQPAPRETFLARVDEAAPRDGRWVAAGDYRVARELLWRRADCVVWLDFPLHTVFWQLLRRSVRRWWTQELLWGKNRETIWTHLRVWSKDSLVYWLFATYWAKRGELLEQLAKPEHRHLKVFRFQRREELDDFLQSIGKR